MAKDSTELLVALDGTIWVGTARTATPSAVSGDLSGSGFTDLGYLDPDSPAEFTLSRETEDIYGWPSLDPLRTLTTAFPKTIKVTFIQANWDVLSTVFGEGTVDDNTTYYTWHVPDDAGEVALALDMSDNQDWRIYINRCKIQGDITWPVSNKEAARFEAEFKILTPADASAALKILTDEPSFSAIAV